MKTSSHRDHLRGPVLRSVSRSFYLSLRILPGSLRDPLSLAYLLARATDTIADTPEPPANLRAEALRDLARAIQGAVPGESIARLRDSFGPLQRDEAERSLIQHLPALLEWLDEFEAGDRAEVRSVLEKITQGQTLDLERFGRETSTSTSTSMSTSTSTRTSTSTSTSTSIQALSTSADLDEYTYLVAGCVGEFWTRMCFAHVAKFSDRPEAEMRELGVQYGQGLQLINILRDAGTDLRHGRCYFPADELHSLGIAPAEILREPARVGPVLQRWGEKAEGGIEAGIDYACAIRNRRIRFATALPALIGARTLALLRDAGTEVFDLRVKVPRSDIRSIISSSAITFASSPGLRKSFRRLST